MSQECPYCGYTSEKNRDKDDFRCLNCGTVDTADGNAAKVIGKRFYDPDIKRKKEGNEKRCRKRNTLYFEAVVQYEGVGDIKLFICRFPYQKQWRMFLSTDTFLSFLANEATLAPWAVSIERF